MTEKEKLENSQEIGRCIAYAYINTKTRKDAIKQVLHFYPFLTYADVEIMWMAIDSYEDAEK